MAATPCTSYCEVVTLFREVEARWLSLIHTLVSRGLLQVFFLLLGRGGLKPSLYKKRGSSIYYPRKRIVGS